jgi:hypothetical protein
LLAEAAPRLRAVMRQWALEAHSQSQDTPVRQGSTREYAMSLALTNRLSNEQALNWLDTAGPAHDAWRAQVETQAGWCRKLWTGIRWADVLLQIERLPESQRAAALAHEADVLSRWGQARPALPSRPEFGLYEYADVLLQRVMAARPDQRPPVAMVPAVAAALTSDNARPLVGSDSDNPAPRNIRCAALQWAVSNARAERAADPAQLATSFRFALMPKAEDLARIKDQTDPDTKALVEQGYPLHVARREVTGTVRVRLVRDDAGRIIESRVVARTITAPGLVGQRPVFFETALDAPSIVKARALAGGGARTVEFVWRLE